MLHQTVGLPSVLFPVLSAWMGKRGTSAARLHPGNASSHARIVPMLLRLVPRLQSAFASLKIKLSVDAGFALPLLYEF